MSSMPPLAADPGAIGRVPEAPFLVLPDAAKIFSRRALRFERLAPGNPFAAFLRFMAALSRAQEAALASLPLPAAARLAAFPAKRLLDRRALLEGREWRDALAAIAETLDRAAMPADAAAALRALCEQGEEKRAFLAGRVLDGAFAAKEGAEALFLVAALEVAWTREAGAFAADTVSAGETAACPVCGGPPFASLVCAEGERAGLRYLVCALCGSQWRHVRIKCIVCGGSKGIAYHAVAGKEGPAKAESCPQCKAYTKILYAEKDPAAEPMADDLASLALDVLMNDTGWRRAFPNPFLSPGIA